MKRSQKAQRHYIQFHVRVPLDVEQEGELFVASCAPLDVFSQGETRAEAVKNLGEAIGLFIDTCYQMGTLDQVLSDCGFVPTSRTQDQYTGETLDVPLPLLIARKHAQDHAC
jgi:predicted RNase H-like HicB family nuclease